MRPREAVLLFHFLFRTKGVGEKGLNFVSNGRVGEVSSREVEVLRFVAKGMTNADVGEELFISPRTVSQHLRSIYNKSGVSS